MSNRVKRGRARPCRPAWALLGAAALASSASWSGEAHAQRGEAYTLNEELSVEPSPNDGFPGAFDTQLARKSAFVGSLPTLSFYYGATDDLSVGANALSFLPLLGGSLSGSLFARYRLGSTPWFRSTADVMLGGLKAGSSGDYLGLVLVGSNTEFALTRRQRLTLNGWYGQVEAGFGQGRLDVDALFLGATYSLVLARWVAFHVTGLYVTSGSLTLDLPGVDLGVSLNGTGGALERILVRGTASLRAGSWLFDLGAVRAGSSILPWAGIAFEVGG